MKSSPALSPYRLHIDEERISVGDGDNWPMTWAADGALYAFFTDGFGFGPALPQHIGSAPAVITGTPPAIAGRNLRSPSGTVVAGHGEANAKACGLIAVDGVLYCLLRNMNPEGAAQGTGSSLMLSTDGGGTWTWVDWQWREIGYPVWINAGQDYGAARDDHVYFVSPDGPSAYVDYAGVLLARAHRDRIVERSAYEFFAGVTTDGEPQWSDYDRRRPCFSDPAGCFRPEMVYNPGIDRYMLFMSSPRLDWNWWRAPNPNRVSRLAVYESVQPWGPWLQIAYDRDWGEREDRFQPRVPAKWIDAAGTTFFLAYSCVPRGPYRLNVHRCRLSRR